VTPLARENITQLVTATLAVHGGWNERSRRALLEIARLHGLDSQQITRILEQVARHDHDANSTPTISRSPSPARLRFSASQYFAVLWLHKPSPAALQTSDAAPLASQRVVLHLVVLLHRVAQFIKRRFDGDRALFEPADGVHDIVAATHRMWRNRQPARAERRRTRGTLRRSREGVQGKAAAGTRPTKKPPQGRLG